MRDDGLWVYQRPHSGGLYLLSADVGGGGEGHVAEIEDDERQHGDFSAAVMWDVRSGEQVASYNGIVKPYDYAILLERWATEYHGAFIAPERNGPGSVVCEILSKDRLYTNLMLERMSTDQWAYGFYTTKQLKTMMVASLDEGLKTRQAKINDRRILDQAADFVAKVDNQGRVKYEAASGSYDDLLIAAAAGFHFRDQVPELLPIKRWERLPDRWGRR